MNIYPAVDMYEGKVVRLLRGDFKKETVYSDSPAEMAKAWEDEGAEWIHVVDLEGAKTGTLKNKDSLLKIREAVDCKIQFGGGMRDERGIEDILARGIDRVVIGTKALEPRFLEHVISLFKEKIAVGLDVQGGVVRTEGWLKESGQTLVSALESLDRLGVETVIYTDIQKDGMMQGPNFEGLQQVLDQTRARVILSGGVSSAADIERSAQIRQKNFEGVIIGRALYEHKVNLHELIAMTKG